MELDPLELKIQALEDIINNPRANPQLKAQAQRQLDEIDNSPEMQQLDKAMQGYKALMEMPD